MATGEIVEPREIVKANNELFRCKYKIKDVVAARIFMAFASLVDHKDVNENQSFVEYRISASSILSDNCDSGEKYRQLQEAARTLIHHDIELRISEREYYFYTLFSKIGYKDGIIIGEFHKDLMPFFIIARDKFTKIKLDEYIKLPSIYSQGLFGFLKSWSNRREITVNLDDLHNMLDTPQSFRKNFTDFKRFVLDKSYKDINSLTSLRYQYEPIKKGRAYTSVKFTFIKHDKNNQQSSIPQPLSYPEKKNSPYYHFRKFERSFHNRENRSEAVHLFKSLYESGIAPTSDDVPADNELSVLAFLKQWQAEKMEIETND